MLSYYFIRTLVKGISHIPFRILYVLSDLLFYPFYHLVRYRRKIVRKNLTESFPEKSIDEIKQIEKKFYHYFIDMALESCKMISISPEEIMKRMTFPGIETANELLRNGQSIAAYIGHYGNWEWICSISFWLHKGTVPAQIYHKLRNKAMDRLMREVRERNGNVCVEMYQTVRYMAGAAADPHPYIIGFITDQSPKRREVKNYLPFLNHQVAVLTGTEKTVKHFGYQALFLSVQRIQRGYYKCEITKLHDDPQSLPDFELTERYFQRLEQDIRQHPEYYLWTHKRFKYIKDSNQQIYTE